MAHPLFSRRKQARSLDDVETAGDLYTWPDPSRPSALLVPPHVHVDRRGRAVARRAVLATAAVAVLATLSGLGSWAAVTQATEDRAAAEAKAQTATARLAKVAPVAAYYDQVIAQQAQLTGQLREDISYARMAGQLFGAVPAGVTVAGLVVEPGAGCPGPDPFTAPATIGCIQLTGTGPAGAVADFVDNLNDGGADAGLTGAFVSSMASSSGQMTYALSVSYTSALYSGRFVPGADPTDLDGGTS